jgi:ubiquinone/menaquinone biosynthesis C-methylase UbiE
MSRAGLAIARVLSVLALGVVVPGCESRTEKDAPPAVAQPAAAAPAKLPAPSTRELLTDAPPPPEPAPTTTTAASQPESQPAAAATTEPEAGVDPYEYRPGSRDGIDKWYMGRQIAHVVSGHQTVGWLERAEREQEERPSRLIEALKKRVEPDDVIADIGAGSGYYSIRLAPLVPQGKVLACDIQQEMLDIVKENAKKDHANNVETVLGTIKSPNLPHDSIDYALLVDAYHEFDHPREMMVAIRKALKPGGRVILLEFRGEDANVPIKTLHKMTEAQAVRELEAAGLKHVETLKDLPWQHVMFFERPRQIGQ